MKTPIVITSLEEDFKKIGLIKATPVAETTEAPKAEAEGETVEEARIKAAIRGGKKVRQQRTSAKEKRMAKKYRRSASGKMAARKRKRLMKKPSFMRRLKKLAMKAMRLGTRKESVEQTEAFDRAEALKSFANAAIIAEKLANHFEGFIESLEIDDSIEESADTLADIAGVCEDVAEVLAEMATALHEGKGGEDFTGVFNEGMDFILDAVDLYESMKEEEEDDEESEDEESEESEVEGK